MNAQGPRQTTGGWERKDARNLNQAEKTLIRKLKAAGHSRNQIAVKLGRGNATISRVLRDAGGTDAKQQAQYWSKEEDGRLIHLSNDGKSQQEIADAIGRSRNAVAIRLSVHRKAALDGTEIRYTKTSGTAATKPTSCPDSAVVADAPEDIFVTPLGLPAETDLYTTWSRAVFGLAGL